MRVIKGGNGGAQSPPPPPPSSSSSSSSSKQQQVPRQRRLVTSNSNSNSHNSGVGGLSIIGGGGGGGGGGNRNSSNRKKKTTTKLGSSRRLIPIVVMAFPFVMGSVLILVNLVDFLLKTKMKMTTTTATTTKNHTTPSSSSSSSSSSMMIMNSLRRLLPNDDDDNDLSSSSSSLSLSLSLSSADENEYDDEDEKDDTIMSAPDNVYLFGQPDPFANVTPHSDQPDPVKSIFAEAGMTLSADETRELPSWDGVVRLLGGDGGPRIYRGGGGCRQFRRSIPAVERNLGCSGMFNSGTNLVTQLLKENCKIPERVSKYGINATREAHGIRWQVPWGKHTHARYRRHHSTEKARDIVKETVLPVVTIRNPHDWMQSMCRNSYSAKWNFPSPPTIMERQKEESETPMERSKRRQRQFVGDHRCPYLVRSSSSSSSSDGQAKAPLVVRYADDRVDAHDSLADLWNDWYNGYARDASFPFLMVRFEDLIFHSKSVTGAICRCAGGRLRTDRPFRYIVDSAKDGPGHGKVSERTGMVRAWIRYGTSARADDYRPEDYRAAVDTLDADLMAFFNYRHPPPPPSSSSSSSTSTLSPRQQQRRRRRQEEQQP